MESSKGRKPKAKRKAKVKAMSKKNNWRGCENIEFVNYNEWADPDIVYNGYVFNYWDIEDALWNDFLDATGYDDSDSDNPEIESEFDLYVQENAECYLSDCIFGGYFKNGSKSWHDR